MIKKIMILLVLVAILLLAGCAKPECKKDSDCSSRSCFSSMCVKKECKYTAIPGCCGNDICEDTENKCDCWQDCGACPSDPGSNYLEYICTDDQECVTSVFNQSSETVTEVYNIPSGPALMLKFTYDTPFDIDSSTLRTEFSIDQTINGLKSVKILKVEFYEKEDDKTRPLGEKTINKVLYDTTTSFPESFTFKLPISAESKKEIRIKIFTEFVTNTGSGDNVQQSTSEGDLPFELVFVNPSITPECPSDIDDSNPCTIDRCGPETDYFIEHTPKAGLCCGNYICDSGEDSCSCSIDCGSCNRLYGDYIQYKCVSNRCVSSLREEIRPYTKVDDINLGNFIVEATTTYDIPFHHDGSDIDIAFDVLSKPDDFISLTCDTVQLLAGSELLGDKASQFDLRKVGDTYRESIGAEFVMADIEESKGSVKVKFRCDLKKLVNEEVQTNVQNVEISLGTLTFVNPEVLS